MGLLDFLKPKNNKSKVDFRKEQEKKNIIDAYEKLQQETKRLQEENYDWQKDFNKIIELRNKASLLEKEKKLHESINLYLKSIEFGEQSNRLNINNYAHDIERVIVLFGKTKQKDKLIEFLKRIISAYPDYTDVKKWAVRLSKFNVGSNSKEITIKKSDIKKQIANNPTLVERSIYNIAYIL